MNERNDMSCTCDRDAFSQMPVPTPSVKDLQAEGLAITDAAIEVANVIRKALFGDGPENNEKRNGPVSARATLMHQNMLLKELLEKLKFIADELGC